MGVEFRTSRLLQIVHGQTPRASQRTRIRPPRFKAMKITVIICTHNPREDYLGRTLKALASQTGPDAQWELLLVDNGSDQPLASHIELFWHPEARHIREDELGLTPARLRGIVEAKGDLLVFVDDDNVLQHDYLEAALRISATHPHLGAFGGNIEPEFEVEPNPRFESLLPSLAIKKVIKAKWANFGNQSVPFGAGLCVKAEVARAYAVKVSSSKIRRQLDRRGASLMGGGDLDLAMTSYDSGMGVGLFGELVVTHLIDKRRLSPQYLHRICVGGSYGSYFVTYLHTGVAPQYHGTLGFVIDSLKQMARTCLGRPLLPVEKALREAERLAARDIRLYQLAQKVEIQREREGSDG
jgi:glycosyltransferase involved in cell wall biosynthesis